jgi:DNA (cytosine-5)-methyltransferase 1
MKKNNVLSLFSGGGGLDIGFAAAGFSIICSTDIDDFSCKTLELNSGGKSILKHTQVVKGDLKDLSAKKLLLNTKVKKNDIDVVIGGPPCQAFSVFGRRRGLKDPRGNLIWDFLRIVDEIKPKAFVFENVAGFKSIDNGGIYQRLLELLSFKGKFTVSDHAYEMADFGIPQSRKRIFFIGFQAKKRIPPMIPTHGDNSLFGLRPLVTVRQALNCLPQVGSKNIVPNHIGRVHSQRIVERYKSLAFGERDPITRINKLNPDRPSFTIIVGSDAGGGKGHVHPFEPREVTPRESARIQTFPDWWEFFGKGRHVIRQVGNAVPPLFAAQIAGHIKKHIFNSTKTKSYDELIKILNLTYLK